MTWNAGEVYVVYAGIDATSVYVPTRTPWMKKSPDGVVTAPYDSPAAPPVSETNTPETSFVSRPSSASAPATCPRATGSVTVGSAICSPGSVLTSTRCVT